MSKILQKKAAKVLVLGEDASIVLAIARSLGRRGVRVHLAWCPEDTPARWSTYVSKVHSLPTYHSGCDTWLDSLLALVATERFDLVIPATEAAVLPLQLQRDRLNGCNSIYLLNQRAFSVAFDKCETYSLARSIGIPVPDSVIVTRSLQIEDVPDRLKFPVVVKSACSVRHDDVLAKNFVRRAYDRPELVAHCQALAERGDRLLVQRFVEGTGVGVEILADHGEVLLAFQHLRLHETSGYGSSYRVSERVNRALLEASMRLLRALDYTGVAMVEFRVDHKSGQWYLLELNGRFWGSLPLATAAGADFPYYLYQLLVEGNRTFSQNYTVGLRCRNVPRDARWFWRSLRSNGRREGRPSDEAHAWSINKLSRKQLLRDLARATTFRDRVDTFAVDDPTPCLVELVQFGKACLKWTVSSTSERVA